MGPNQTILRPIPLCFAFLLGCRSLKSLVGAKMGMNFNWGLFGGHYFGVFFSPTTVEGVSD